MYQQNWQGDRYQDEIFLDDVEVYQKDEEPSIFDIVYREVGCILLKYTNLNLITCPNTLHYITLQFNNDEPFSFLFQPNYILVEQLAVNPALKDIAEQLQIEDLINHNQNDPEYFQDYYQHLIEEIFKSHLNQAQEIFLRQIELLQEQRIKPQVDQELQSIFQDKQFQFPLKLDFQNSELPENQIKYKLFESLQLLQSNYLNTQSKGNKSIKLESSETVQQLSGQKTQQENVNITPFVQPLVISSLNKEKIKMIINWLIQEKIAIPEIILCAELKNRGNGMNLTFNPNQQMLNKCAFYYDLFCEAQQNQSETKNIKEENTEEVKTCQEFNIGKQKTKITEYHLLIRMLDLVVQQQESLKEKIIQLVKYSQLKNQIKRLSRVQESDAHYKIVKQFIQKLETILCIYDEYENDKQNQFKNQVDKKSQINSDNLSENEDENKPIKCQKKYYRLLKLVVKLILIESLEKEIPIPEILTCLWFKKHKEKIVEGQIINQNSVQILPSKQRLIPSLQLENRLKLKQEQVQLQTLLDLPDTATKELDDFENFISQFTYDIKYGRDVILIEKILIVVNNKKDSIQDQLIQVMNDYLKIEKAKDQLREKLILLPKLRTNKTQINDEPILENIIKIIDNLQLYISSIQKSKPYIITKQINNRTKKQLQQSSQNQQIQQFQKLDKEELKVFILSGLITLIDNEVSLPELISYLGIKNKTQKFSLQINKNYKLQEYITIQMQLNQVEITDQIESKLLIKKIKIQEGENIPIIHNKEQVSEPQLIIRALRLLSNCDMTKQLSDIWQKPSVISLKNQVYKNCLKKNKNDTTIGQIKNLFYKIDNKYEIFNNNQQ
ncbi:unnamed protein product [Paramecium pentaurelia]|uniref:Uncharacterized protein n=1 Tax=Paramecium pentaurelia TaxID=43138 RepID=A0A8S1S6A0_9CILI|nr:unnamed protein product [Paramecium pentaurelia]